MTSNHFNSIVITFLSLKLCLRDCLFLVNKDSKFDGLLSFVSIMLLKVEFVRITKRIL